MKDSLTNATEMSYVLNGLQNSNGQQLACSGSVGQACDDMVLDCGKPVNFTYYDNLLGVANRNKHPTVPEPNVVLMFKRNDDKSTDFDIDLLERRLKRAKREVGKKTCLF